VIWLKVEVGFAQHRKIQLLRARLGWSERDARGALVGLWEAVRAESPDGDVSSWTPEQFAVVMGEPTTRSEELCGALSDCGLVSNGTVHGWMEHNGQFTKDAERKRLSRTSPPPSTDVPGSPRLARAPRAGAGAGAREASPPHPTPPDWIPLTAWQDWCDFRTGLGKRCPWTPRAAELSIAKLDRLRTTGNDPQAVIEHSILNGWKGLFALNENQNGRTRRRYTETELIAAAKELP